VLPSARASPDALQTNIHARFAAHGIRQLGELLRRSCPRRKLALTTGACQRRGAVVQTGAIEPDGSISL
jgi:hypothetical protein